MSAAVLTSSVQSPARAPRENLRVLFVVPGAAEGSSMIFAMRLAGYLRREGVALSIFHLASRTSPVILIREWVRFRRELRRFRPEVVHAQFGTMTALFTAIAAGRCPVVITYRGSDLNPGPAAEPWRRKLRSLMGRFLSQIASIRAAQVICVSSELRERLWWRRGLAVVLPSGVDADVFVPQPRGAARKQLNWDPDQPVVLFNAGHNPAVKRLDLAIRAVELARGGVPGVRMVVLEGNTPPDDVPVLMNAADCLLLTSDREGAPTVVQEALACNLPVVSVDAGDVRTRLAGVRQCHIVPRDPARIAEVLTEVLRMRSRSDGRRRIADCSTAAVSAELRRIYSAVRKHPAPHEF